MRKTWSLTWVLTLCGTKSLSRVRRSSNPDQSIERPTAAGKREQKKLYLWEWGKKPYWAQDIGCSRHLGELQDHWESSILETLGHEDYQILRLNQYNREHKSLLQHQVSNHKIKNSMCLLPGEKQEHGREHLPEDLKAAVLQILQQRIMNTLKINRKLKITQQKA